MSCNIARNVASSLASTSALFVAYTTIEIRGSSIATFAEFVGSVGKRTTSTVQCVTCAIRTILGVPIDVSNRARGRTVPYAWKIYTLREYLVRFWDVVIYCIRPVSKRAWSHNSGTVHCAPHRWFENLIARFDYQAEKSNTMDQCSWFWLHSASYS